MKIFHCSEFSNTGDFADSAVLETWLRFFNFFYNIHKEINNPEMSCLLRTIYWELYCTATRYHKTQSIAGFINSFEDLNQQKTSILSSPKSPTSAVKFSLCFARRIENNKTKKIETKAKAFNKFATVIVVMNALALQYKRVLNAFGTRSRCSSLSCTVHREVVRYGLQMRGDTSIQTRSERVHYVRL